LLKEFHARYIISTYIYSYISCIDFHPCPDLDLSIRHACDSVCDTLPSDIFQAEVTPPSEDIQHILSKKAFLSTVLRHVGDSMMLEV